MHRKHFNGAEASGLHTLKSIRHISPVGIPLASARNVLLTPTMFDEICAWPNLLLAWKKAGKGKHGLDSVARFEYELADNLLTLQEELRQQTYQPGTYTHFYIHEPKRRLISAAPFRDRVVHHALCNIIEPTFEELFIPDSYANRKGKGTHKAIDRVQQFAKRYPYCLRLDILQHFPSLDHQILFNTLQRFIKDEKTLWLIQTIIRSGQHIHEQEFHAVLFPGDDLLDLTRPTGLPIGNLTSQFWSNCYLHPLDLFIKRGLGCKAYVRYVDDMILLGNSKAQLWEWKQAIHERLHLLRLRFHRHSAQVMQTKDGIPWLGMVLYPDHRRIKQRKVVHATQRLTKRYDQWQQGEISFAEFDASVQGWINHVRYADTWGLRGHVLRRFELAGKSRSR